MIFKLESIDYQYAYVAGYNKNYLWLLSRVPSVSDAIKSDFLKTAKENGFKVNDIIFVDHSATDKLSKETS